MKTIRRLAAKLRDLPVSLKLVVVLVVASVVAMAVALNRDEATQRSPASHRAESAGHADSTLGEAASQASAPAADSDESPSGSGVGSGSPSGSLRAEGKRSLSGVSAGGGGRDSGAVSNPARDRIAFVEGGEIQVMHLDGTGKTSLGAGSDPDWSPDGTRILFSLDPAGGDCFLSDSPCDVWVMSADGSNRRLLRAGRMPDWSPDGRRIAYVWGEGDHEIYVMNADGSGSVQLTQTPDSVGGRGLAHSPDWSPDGSQIALTRREKCGPPAEDACWTTRAYVMNAAGSGMRNLTSQWGRHPVWSPDGAKVAFSGVPIGQGDNEEIFTIQSDGSGLRRLTQDTRTGSPMDNFDGLPAWSPDGRIIFTRDPDGPTGWASCYYFYGQNNCGTGGPALPELFLMNADGSGKVRIGAGFGATFAPRR